MCILQGAPQLQDVAHIPELGQLLRSMLAFETECRPTVGAVMSHPLWWAPEKRLSFICRLSNCLKRERSQVEPLNACTPVQCSRRLQHVDCSRLAIYTSLCRVIC